MTVKNASLCAFVGTSLLAVVCAIGFVEDVSTLVAGAIAPMIALKSLIHFGLPLYLPERRDLVSIEEGAWLALGVVLVPNQVLNRSPWRGLGVY